MTRYSLIIIVLIMPIWVPFLLGSNDMHVQSFEQAWQIVNYTHYDSTFGGIDWNKIHDEYQPRIEMIANNEDFCQIMNEMLRELELSHNVVIPGKTAKSTISHDGQIGMDIRIIDGDAMITEIDNNSSAYCNLLKPGFIITSIAGRKSEDIIHDFNQRGNSVWTNDNLVDEFRSFCTGPIDSSLSISYLDENFLPSTTELTYLQRQGKTIINRLLPPFYIEFSYKILPYKIGYIAFNIFMPPVDEKFINAMEKMDDISGLIIDIRGNPGGSHVIGEKIAGKLITEKTLFSLFQYRDHIDSIYVNPAEKTFNGPIVILIDECNASASERFAGCMQSIGRAIIVGKRSRGSVGPSKTIQLPNGTTFIHLIALSKTSDGKILEGKGVKPDIELSQNRRNLLKSMDTQLQEAISIIKTQIKKGQ